MTFYGSSLVVQRTSDMILVLIQVTVRPWQRFMLSKCLEYDSCLQIFGGEGASPVGYLSEYRDYIFSI